MLPEPPITLLCRVGEPAKVQGSNLYRRVTATLRTRNYLVGLREKNNNPCGPADEQNTARVADQLVRCGDLLQQDEGADTR